MKYLLLSNVIHDYYPCQMFSWNKISYVALVNLMLRIDTSGALPDW